MIDIDQFVQNCKITAPEFAGGFDAGYVDFKIGVVLKQAREKSGLTQEAVARKLKTQKSAISRIENHADDVRLSTLRRYADAVGARLNIQLLPSVPKK